MPPKEAANKPSESLFKQQKLKAWQPILTPTCVVITFLAISVFFIPLGAVLLSASNGVVEEVITYDNKEVSSWCDDVTKDDCSNQKVVLGTTKDIVFKVKQDMAKPVHVYYQLENFYQNHRRYVKSRDDNQLRGQDPYTGKAGKSYDSSTKMNDVTRSYFQDCTPLQLPNHVSASDCTWNTTRGYTRTLGDIESKTEIPCKIMWPCGLIAGSFFNDIFKASYIGNDATANTVNVDKEWDETNISWESDRRVKFKNPVKGDTSGWSYADEVAKGESSMYYMLYQQYSQAAGYPVDFPKLAEQGVENEHFIVWMRTAGLPTFRKLYARIDKDLKKGEYVKIRVVSQFEVDKFNGKKSLVLSTTSWMGGKNPFLGIAYLIIGSLSFVLALVFFIMDKSCPRRLGDTNYLVWKERS